MQSAHGEPREQKSGVAAGVDALRPVRDHRCQCNGSSSSAFRADVVHEHLCKSLVSISPMGEVLKLAKGDLM